MIIDHMHNGCYFQAWVCIYKGGWLAKLLFLPCVASFDLTLCCYVILFIQSYMMLLLLKCLTWKSLRLSFRSDKSSQTLERKWRAFCHNFLEDRLLFCLKRDHIYFETPYWAAVPSEHTYPPASNSEYWQRIASPECLVEMCHLRF